MKPYPSEPLSYFLFYIRQYKWYVGIFCLVIILNVILMKLTPYYFSQLIDVLGNYQADKTGVWSAIYVLLFLLFMTDLGSNILRRISFHIVTIIDPDMSVQIIKDSTEYVLHHSAGFLTDQQTGKLSARVTQLSDMVSRLLWIFMWDFYMNFVSMAITIVMLALVNLWFAALYIFWVGLLLSIIYYSTIHIKKYSSAAAETRAITTGRVVDAISNALLVKSFANFKFEQRLLAPVLENERIAERQLINKNQNARTVQLMLVGLFNLSTLALSVYLWQKGLISEGNIVLVLLLTSNIMNIFHSIVHGLLDFHKTVGTLSNALQIVSTAHDVTDVQNAKNLQVKKASIEFKHVDFSYQFSKPIFKDFSLYIKAGERVGLVGISGSGKSTFINLLQRLYDVTGGEILIDGQNIARVSQESLHQNIAVIPQDTALFHRTIAENIGYGKPEADRQKMVTAAKKAYAHKFIIQTQNGYDSMVGDRGVKLSGGERQRIAIARAILKKAPILILDEATSALDSESEKYIQNSLKKLMRGKTVIAIAHRLSTLKEMDRIVVMGKGRVIEQGSPAQLLKKKGKYAKLWRTQTQ